MKEKNLIYPYVAVLLNNNIIDHSKLKYDKPYQDAMIRLKTHFLTMLRMQYYTLINLILME